MTQATPFASVPTWTATPDVTLQVNSVAVSADGNCCVFGTSNEFGTGQFALYCYDGAGAMRWSSQLGAPGSTQGVFWVAASADGRFAAAGGETSKTAAFLTAYRVADGAQMLNAAPSSRVNQVALSGDGGALLAVFGDTVQLYTYADGAYTLASQQTFPGSYCNSCALSPDGLRAVVSCTIYNSGAPSTGQVVSLSVAGEQLAVSGAWPCPVGVMRVAMAATGKHWGAALHDGGCALFDPDHASAPLWRYRPDVPQLSVAYGFDITDTADGRVVLAVGANLSVAAPAPAGYLYLVESVPSGAGWAGQLCWASELQFSANPGVSLDREARYVTATDGAPGDETPGQVSESPGNFYLFDGAAGAPLWSYATTVMNWPMVITPDAACAVGGSDDGSVYFWGRAAS